MLAVGVVLAGLLFLVAVRRRATMRRIEAADAARRPLGTDGVVVGAAEIMRPGSTDRAVLLIHGFNDTPQSMAYLAERVQAAGYTVRALRLPGHGCSLREMAREQRAAHWRHAVRDAYDALARTHAQLFVCGQSMGGALSVLLATESPPLAPPMSALVLLAPYLGMPNALRWKLQVARLVDPFVTYLPSTGGERSIHDPAARAQALGPGIVTPTTLQALETVALAAQEALPRLLVPTLYVQSRQDNRITVADAEADFAEIGARDKRQQWLTGSGHILSADYERERVASLVVEWFDGHGR